MATEEKLSRPGRPKKLPAPPKDEASPPYVYFKNQFRRFQVTSELLCRGQHEMEHVANSYLCLLQSVKKHEELLTKYKGAGERTTEQAANLVGLKLPETYEEPK